MKYNQIISIIFSLTIGLIVLVPSIESYTVWVHNKMLSGTQAYANIIDSNTTCNGQFRNSGFSVAQRGFDVPISSDLKSYSIVFIVDGSFYDKCRGPYNNDHDTEWKLTGSTLQWDLEQQA